MRTYIIELTEDEIKQLVKSNLLVNGILDNTLKNKILLQLEVLRLPYECHSCGHIVIPS